MVYKLGEIGSANGNRNRFDPPGLVRTSRKQLIPGGCGSVFLPDAPHGSPACDQCVIKTEYPRTEERENYASRERQYVLPDKQRRLRHRTEFPIFGCTTRAILESTSLDIW